MPYALASLFKLVQMYQVTPLPVNPESIHPSRATDRTPTDQSKVLEIGWIRDDESQHPLAELERINECHFGSCKGGPLGLFDAYLGDLLNGQVENP